MFACSKNLSETAAHGEIGLYERLGGVVIETVAGRGLEMPGEFACAGFHRQDTGRVQAVAFAAKSTVPRGCIAGPEEQQVQLGIVDHALPHRASAACFPPLFAVPGLGGCFHGFGFEALLRIAGDGVETPGLFSGFRVVRGDVTANSEFRPCVSDHNLVLRDPWGRGDGVGLVRVRGLDAPDPGPGALVERDEPPVERANVDHAVVQRNAAVYDIAAVEESSLAVDLRVIGPFHLTGLGIEREHHAP